MGEQWFTAQQMRNAADSVDKASVNDYGEYCYEKSSNFNPDEVRDMLRYAAIVIERCEKAMEKLKRMTDKNSPSWSLDSHAVALEDMDKIKYILYGGSKKDTGL